MTIWFLKQCPVARSICCESTELNVYAPGITVNLFDKSARDRGRGKDESRDSSKRRPGGLVELRFPKAPLRGKVCEPAGPCRRVGDVIQSRASPASRFSKYGGSISNLVFSNGLASTGCAIRGRARSSQPRLGASCQSNPSSMTAISQSIGFTNQACSMWPGGESSGRKAAEGCDLDNGSSPEWCWSSARASC